MPRYFKQKDDYGCGPMALLNVRLWAGQPVTYKQNYEECKKACKTTEDGTHRSNFNRALKRFASESYTISNQSSLNMADLINHIKLDGIAVLLHYFPSAWFSHFCLVIGRKDNGDWILINDDKQKLRFIVSHSEMKKYMKHQFIDGVWFPKLWLIHQYE